jgi:sugar transferase (PEP-CTERM system associated)
MKISLKSRKSRAVFLLWFAEVALVVLAVWLAIRLRFYGADPAEYQFFADTASIPMRALVVALFITGAMAAFGLYQVHTRHNRLDFVLRLGLSFAFGGTALLVLYYLVPQTYIGRGVMAMALAMALVMVAGLRLLSQQMFDHELFRRRVLVFGAGRNADLINSSLRRRSDRHSFVVVGYVPIAGQPEQVPEQLLVRTDCGLPELARLLNVHEIVVAPDERRGGLPMDEMLACAQRGVNVTDLSSFFEREAGMVKLNVVDPSWLVFSGGFDHSMPRRLSKRFFDLLAAWALLLVAWPVMLLVALCVWLESGAPIFYRQVRVGENGRGFELIKFRSMRTDAEKDGVARWASKDDDRSTRVGRFIRATRLDELPQLLNVLRGDMSFVGPRPERPQFVDVLSQEIRYYGIRHSVKPGLTGWAQLRYPYGASVRDAEEKLKFDLFYVKNQGLVFDLMIMLQTVEVVMFRRGAR